MEAPETSLPEEVTKQSYRKKVWDYLEKHNFAFFPRPVHGRIPNFRGCHDAAHRLAGLEEFKNAHTVKINPDKPQEWVRILALEGKKTVLMPIARMRYGLFQKLQVASQATKQDIKFAASFRGAERLGQPVGLDSKIQVDLVILGSVAVSKEGYRIGKGEGYADLEFAIMKEIGAVNDNTVVMTSVHDCQVFDQLPVALFKEHDVPVDIIVTPNEVINVSTKLPKPKGILWELISPKRLEEIPVLKLLREKQIAQGKDCQLMVEVPEEEETMSYQKNFRQDRNSNPERNSVPERKRTDNFQKEREGVNLNARTRIFYSKSRAKSQAVPQNDTAEKNDFKTNPQPNTYRKPRSPIMFSLRVGNLSPKVRVQELKSALAECGVKPTHITWRGRCGYALLHFAKPDVASEVNSLNMDSVVTSLKTMKLGEEALAIEVSNKNGENTR